ncbi:MAG TPA: hypothetical protein VFY14_15680 [Streptomyces sp.]|nr:hypothetical protein [Streptomyces sp.]
MAADDPAVELAARTLADAEREHDERVASAVRNCSPLPSLRPSPEQLARVVLAALRDAGLMPPGGGIAPATVRQPYTVHVSPPAEVRYVPVPYDPRTGRMLA